MAGASPAVLRAQVKGDRSTPVLARKASHVSNGRIRNVRDRLMAPVSIAAATQTSGGLVGVASLTLSDERIARMWAMSRRERVDAARRGAFTLGEMLRWAARAPHEVPLVNGEYFFITAFAE